MSLPKELWVDNSPIGGNGGAEFTLAGKSGAFLNKLRVYHGDLKWGSGRRGCLNGIELEFSDGSKASTGNTSPNDTFKEIYLGPSTDSKIKSMSLWGHGDGKWDRTSLLHFETTKGEKFEAGWKAPKENEYKMDCGSGLIIGFKGRSGGGIDALAPIFLKPVKKQYIDKVTYPTLDLKNTCFLQVEFLARQKGKCENTTGKFTFINEKSITKTATWNSKFTIEASIEVGLKTGFIFAEAEGKLGLKVGGQFDWGGSKAEAHVLRWHFENEIKGPDDEVECTATYYTGQLDVDYEGTYNIVDDKGKTYSFPTSGTLTQVVYSEASVNVKPLNRSNENRELNGDGGTEYFLPQHSHDQTKEQENGNQEWAGRTSEGEVDEFENEEARERSKEEFALTSEEYGEIQGGIIGANYEIGVYKRNNGGYGVDIEEAPEPIYDTYENEDRDGEKFDRNAGEESTEPAYDAYENEDKGGEEFDRNAGENFTEPTEDVNFETEKESNYFEYQAEAEEQGVDYGENAGDGFEEANDEENLYQNQDETEEQAAEENYEESGNRGYENQEQNEYGSYGHQTEGREDESYDGGY